MTLPPPPQPTSTLLTSPRRASIASTWSSVHFLSHDDPETGAYDSSENPRQRSSGLRVRKFPRRPLGKTADKR